MATGPEEIQAAKWELEADTEKFIQTAEVKWTGRVRYSSLADV